MNGIQKLHFEDDGRIPNNADLPLLIYPRVFPESDQLATDFRDLFEDNDWGGIWVNGVFPYHHYHSTAHEVLGVASGSADIQFGGENGEIVKIKAGDAVVIPAGVGHCKIDASADFRVVGAYPEGQDWDLRTGEPDERPDVLHNIAAVPLPRQDPIHGDDGDLLTYWG